MGTRKRQLDFGGRGRIFLALVLNGICRMGEKCSSSEGFVVYQGYFLGEGILENRNERKEEKCARVAQYSLMGGRRSDLEFLEWFRGDTES